MTKKSGGKKSKSRTRVRKPSEAPEAKGVGEADFTLEAGDAESAAQWAVAEKQEELMRSVQARYRALWAICDELGPKRDRWLEQYREAEAQSAVMHENGVDSSLRGSAALDKSRACFALQRSYSARLKRLTTLNNEIFKATREILQLEDTYPIVSERRLSDITRTALAEDDPGLVAKSLSDAKRMQDIKNADTKEKHGCVQRPEKLLRKPLRKSLKALDGELLEKQDEAAKFGDDGVATWSRHPTYLPRTVLDD